MPIVLFVILPVTTWPDVPSNVSRAPWPTLGIDTETSVVAQNGLKHPPWRWSGACLRYDRGSYSEGNSVGGGMVGGFKD